MTMTAALAIHLTTLDNNSDSNRQKFYFAVWPTWHSGLDHSQRSNLSDHFNRWYFAITEVWPGHISSDSNAATHTLVSSSIGISFGFGGGMGFILLQSLLWYINEITRISKSQAWRHATNSNAAVGQERASIRSSVHASMRVCLSMI